LHAPDHVAGELIERNKLPIELANKNAATTDRDASVHGPAAKLQRTEDGAVRPQELPISCVQRVYRVVAGRQVQYPARLERRRFQWSRDTGLEDIRGCESGQCALGDAM
jgi:hypothetical protein